MEQCFLTGFTWRNKLQLVFESFVKFVDEASAALKVKTFEPEKVKTTESQKFLNVSR
jgi:hypothetical protein